MKKRKSLLKTALLTVGTLEVINQVIDSNASSNISMRTSGKYYPWKHGDIYYRVFGERGRTPLLLIHDLTAASSDFEWLSIAKNLSDTYRVYCIDLIGCGRSDKPAITYTNYFYVQMITDFVKEVIGEKTAVAATGLSGSFVLMANAIDASLFDKIMLVSPTSTAVLKKTPDDRSKVLLKLFQLPIIGKTLYYMLTSRTSIEDYLTEKCFFNSFHMEPSIVKAYYGAAHSGKGNGRYLLASLESNYLYADITHALHDVSIPITLVVGQNNPNADDLVRNYQSIYPNLMIERVSNAKLLPQLESEREMLDLMRCF